MSSRTLRVQSPHMRGDDVRDFQTLLNRQMKTWGVDYQVGVDGDYGGATRDLAATVLYGLGIARERMLAGVTPELRTKLRHKSLSVTERALYVARAGWRRRLRLQHAHRGVASPLAKILSHSWGWHPGVHDGVDLICEPNAVLHALCDGTVLRADAGGWWGLGAPADPALRAKGDGIIVLECGVNIGPFRRGMRFCYGHAERASVQVGQKVRAGDALGRAGFANAWHVHFMANGRGDAKGVGDRDPWPYVDYAVKH